MANDIDFIGRDLGTPFNPANVIEQRDWEDWAIPPTSGGLIVDLMGLTPNSRAVRMLDPGLIPPGGAPAVPGGEAGEVLLPTPDRVAPQAFYDVRGLHEDLDVPFNVPGVGEVTMWSFRNNQTGRATWPAQTIRVKEGQVVHTRMSNRNGPHTIHHHGIEPTPMNDGVGHLTMDINDLALYDYQWLAKEAGTYFYHCHVNTVLHFEMGMYGMLIIDPDVPGAPFADGGAGAVFQGDAVVPYQSEAIWVADDIDLRWHELDQPGYGERAGVLAGDFVRITNNRNPRLHDFNPTVFVVSGVPAPVAPGGDNALLGAAGKTLTSGQRLLVRALNASYCTTRWTFPTSLQGTVLAVDGRTLGRAPFGRYSAPYTLASIGHQFQLTTAQRWDILVDTNATPPGQHNVTIDYHHWYTDQRIFTVRLPVTITAGA